MQKTIYSLLDISILNLVVSKYNWILDTSIKIHGYPIFEVEDDMKSKIEVAEYNQVLNLL